MEKIELLAALRELDNRHSDEQEIRALHIAIQVLRAAAPEIAAEGLDAPLLRIDLVHCFGQFDIHQKF